MRNLLRFLLRYHRIILFLLLEILAFIFIARFSSFQRARIFRFKHKVLGGIERRFDHLSSYFSLVEENRELARENARLYNMLPSTFYNPFTDDVIDSSAQKKYVYMPQTNLEEITSPFTNQLSLSYHSMTPTEIAICNMIRNGMRTKEIAEMRSVSEATINRHREKIRRKLKITNQDVNLATFLQSSMWEEK